MLGLGAMAMAATAYSRLYVFGETLSDVGALLAAAGITSSPYQSPGFDSSSPPVWAEDIAAHLGLQANSWTSGGSNVDPGNIDGVLPDGFSLPSLAQQIQNYLAAAGPNGPDPNGLFVVGGGSGAVALAGQLGSGNVIAGTAASFTGPSFAPGSPPSFTDPPVIFGLPPGGQIVPGEPDPNCTGNCSPPEPQFVCNEPCIPLPPTPTPPSCLENCVELAPQCLENCTTPTETCTQNCDDNPPSRTPAIVATPEPGTIAVILGGLSLLVLVRQRRPLWARRERA